MRSSRGFRRALASWVIVCHVGGMLPLAFAGPEGGSVAAGSANIASQAGATTITQTTDRAVVNWRGFSTSAGETVRFNQPGATSVTLNRVTGDAASRLDGSLTANGRVFLLNPNGVVFGAGARVNVGGLVASTLSMTDADFMAGRHNLRQDPAKPLAAVVNQGSIRTAPGGRVALVAPVVSNDGTIVAPGGEVALTAGTRATVNLDGQGLVNLCVAVAGHGSVQAPSGAVGAALASAVNNGHLVEAGGVSVANGVVTLTGAEGVAVHAGTIDVSAAAGQAGRASIEGTQAAVAAAGSTVSARGAGAGQTGGRIQLAGGTVDVGRGARLDASGDAGGGQIGLGGAGARPRTLAVVVEDGAIVSADAVRHGNGGTVVAKAERGMRVRGAISARGGAQGGNGGSVDTSAAQVDVAKTPDLSAPAGIGGTWLIDPNDVTLANGCVNRNVSCTPGDPFSFTTSNDAAFVSLCSVKAAFQGGASTVIVQAGNAGAALGQGDVSVGSPLAFTGIGLGKTLRLIAAHDITLCAVNFSGSDNLNLCLQANTNLSGGGVQLRCAVVTNGGFVHSSGQAFRASAGIDTTVLGCRTGGDVTLIHTGNVSLGGAVRLAAGGTFTSRGTGFKDSGCILATQSGGNIDIQHTGAVCSSARLFSSLLAGAGGRITVKGRRVTLGQLVCGGNSVDVDALAGDLKVASCITTCKTAGATDGHVTLQGANVSLAPGAGLVSFGNVAIHATCDVVIDAGVKTFNCGSVAGGSFTSTGRNFTMTGHNPCGTIATNGGSITLSHTGKVLFKCSAIKACSCRVNGGDVAITGGSITLDKTNVLTGTKTCGGGTRGGNVSFTETGGGIAICAAINQTACLPGTFSSSGPGTFRLLRCGAIGASAVSIGNIGGVLISGNGLTSTGLVCINTLGAVNLADGGRGASVKSSTSVVIRAGSDVTPGLRVDAPVISINTANGRIGGGACGPLLTRGANLDLHAKNDVQVRNTENGSPSTVWVASSSSGNITLETCGAVDMVLKNISAPSAVSSVIARELNTGCKAGNIVLCSACGNVNAGTVTFSAGVGGILASGASTILGGTSVTLIAGASNIGAAAAPLKVATPNLIVCDVSCKPNQSSVFVKTNAGSLNVSTRIGCFSADRVLVKNLGGCATRLSVALGGGCTNDISGSGLTNLSYTNLQPAALNVNGLSATAPGGNVSLSTQGFLRLQSATFSGLNALSLTAGVDLVNCGGAPLLAATNVALHANGNIGALANRIQVNGNLDASTSGCGKSIFVKEQGALNNLTLRSSVDSCLGGRVSIVNNACANLLCLNTGGTLTGGTFNALSVTNTGKLGVNVNGLTATGSLALDSNCGLSFVNLTTPGGAGTVTLNAGGSITHSGPAAPLAGTTVTLLSRNGCIGTGVACGAIKVNTGHLIASTQSAGGQIHVNTGATPLANLEVHSTVDTTGHVGVVDIKNGVASTVLTLCNAAGNLQSASIANLFVDNTGPGSVTLSGVTATGTLEVHARCDLVLAALTTAGASSVHLASTSGSIRNTVCVSPLVNGGTVLLDAFQSIGTAASPIQVNAPTALNLISHSGNTTVDVRNQTDILPNLSLSVVSSLCAPATVRITGPTASFFTICGSNVGGNGNGNVTFSDTSTQAFTVALGAGSIDFENVGGITAAGIHGTGAVRLATAGSIASDGNPCTVDVSGTTLTLADASGGPPAAVGTTCQHLVTSVDTLTRLPGALALPGPVFVDNLKPLNVTELTSLADIHVSSVGNLTVGFIQGRGCTPTVLAATGANPDTSAARILQTGCQAITASLLTLQAQGSIGAFVPCGAFTPIHVRVGGLSADSVTGDINLQNAQPPQDPLQLPGTPLALGIANITGTRNIAVSNAGSITMFGCGSRGVAGRSACAPAQVALLQATQGDINVSTDVNRLDLTAPNANSVSIQSAHGVTIDTGGVSIPGSLAVNATTGTILARNVQADTVTLTAQNGCVRDSALLGSLFVQSRKLTVNATRPFGDVTVDLTSTATKADLAAHSAGEGALSHVTYRAAGCVPLTIGARAVNGAGAASGSVDLRAPGCVGLTCVQGQNIAITANQVDQADPSAGVAITGCNLTLNAARVGNNESNGLGMSVTNVNVDQGVAGASVVRLCNTGTLGISGINASAANGVVSVRAACVAVQAPIVAHTVRIQTPGAILATNPCALIGGDAVAGSTATLVAGGCVKGAGCAPLKLNTDIVNVARTNAGGVIKLQQSDRNLRLGQVTSSNATICAKVLTTAGPARSLTVDHVSGGIVSLFSDGSILDGNAPFAAPPDVVAATHLTLRAGARSPDPVVAGQFLPTIDLDVQTPILSVTAVQGGGCTRLRLSGGPTTLDLVTLFDNTVASSGNATRFDLVAARSENLTIGSIEGKNAVGGTTVSLTALNGAIQNDGCAGTHISAFSLSVNNLCICTPGMNLDTNVSRLSLQSGGSTVVNTGVGAQASNVDLVNVNVGGQFSVTGDGSIALGQVIANGILTTTTLTSNQGCITSDANQNAGLESINVHANKLNVTALRIGEGNSIVVCTSCGVNLHSTLGAIQVHEIAGPGGTPKPLRVFSAHADSGSICLTSATGDLAVTSVTAKLGVHLKAGQRILGVARVCGCGLGTGVCGPPPPPPAFIVDTSGTLRMDAGTGIGQNVGGPINVFANALEAHTSSGDVNVSLPGGGTTLCATSNTGNVFLTANTPGAFAVRNVSAAGIVNIGTMNGDILDSNGPAVNLSACTVHLSGHNLGTASDALETQANHLFADATGDVAYRNSGSATLCVNAPSGNVLVRSDTGNLVANSITAGHAVSLETPAGGIFGRFVPGQTNITAVDGLSLEAGGVVGLGNAPLAVHVTNGRVALGAKGQIGGLSGSLSGSIAKAPGVIAIGAVPGAVLVNGNNDVVHASSVLKLASIDPALAIAVFGPVALLAIQALQTKDRALARSLFRLVPGAFGGGKAPVGALSPQEESELAALFPRPVVAPPPPPVVVVVAPPPAVVVPAAVPAPVDAPAAGGTASFGGISFGGTPFGGGFGLGGFGGLTGGFGGLSGGFGLSGGVAGSGSFGSGFSAIGGLSGGFTGSPAGGGGALASAGALSSSFPGGTASFGGTGVAGGGSLADLLGGAGTGGFPGNMALVGLLSSGGFGGTGSFGGTGFSGGGFGGLSGFGGFGGGSFGGFGGLTGLGAGGLAGLGGTGASFGGGTGVAALTGGAFSGGLGLSLAGSAFPVAGAGGLGGVLGGLSGGASLNGGLAGSNNAGVIGAELNAQLLSGAGTAH